MGNFRRAIHGGTDGGRLVIETLTPLPKDRKCFRMINGVLVERTVDDVLPQLTTNSDGLAKILEGLVKQYQTKEAEMNKWKVGMLAVEKLIAALMHHRWRTIYRSCSSRSCSVIIIRPPQDSKATSLRNDERAGTKATRALSPAQVQACTG